MDSVEIPGGDKGGQLHPSSLVKLTLYYWHITSYVGSIQFSHRKCHITVYLYDLVFHYYLHEGQCVENIDLVVLSG